MSNSLIETVRNVQRKDVVWSERNLSATPFHVNFWVQKRIGGAVAASARYARGVLLDVGCGLKPYEKTFAPFVEKYYGMEYSPDSGLRGNRADVAGDAAAIPFADASVDTILCTEVLEHVKNPEKVIEEFARVLKPDGIVIATAPFIYPVHDAFDFFRYTHEGIAVIMQRHGFGIEKVEPLSGAGLTAALMFNFCLFDLGFMWTKWMYPIGLVLRPVLWLLICLVNLSGWVLEKIVPAKQMAFNHLTIGKKK